MYFQLHLFPIQKTASKYGITGIRNSDFCLSCMSKKYHIKTDEKYCIHNVYIFKWYISFNDH